ncbi:MAG: hypothetical protein D3924_11490, partial [Candidatus Electrothrix sp. AR4]|nr:hypothetical protein [Candidatus Electrothrix sp. AR4]
MLDATKIVEQESFNTRQDDIFLQRIPDDVYKKMTHTFSSKYHFRNGLENGGKMRIANYFVGISSALSDSFNQFIEEMEQGLSGESFPAFQPPNGFAPQDDNLLHTEQAGGFSLGSFDMAITDKGLRNIEFQAVATYPVSSALLNRCLLENVEADNAFIFADSPDTTWDDFKQVYNSIIGGNQSKGIVLTDRKIQQQKTNFEFYATQQELDIPIEIVDMERFFERDGELYYNDPFLNGKSVKITRLYNRIILADALFKDNYPEGSQTCRFRFDRKYNSLKLVNHPVKQFQVSKRLSPYIRHPFNPISYELAEVASSFRQGILKYDDYVWKHKWGGAGHRLFLSPSLDILESLINELDEYIAQKKVDYTIFTTDDGQEKIVELRFMTAHHHAQKIVVPMARIGHVSRNSAGRRKYKIHLSD